MDRNRVSRPIPHVSDQFAPFASQTIPATVSEAPYILDGLLMNEAGRQVTEQFADTAGYTDHVFGLSALLDRRLVLRIRDPALPALLGPVGPKLRFWPG
jgi:TnpA family transposase